jgi:ferritin-like metal-binding protein YciE
MITNLEELYYDQIRDLYSAETQLLNMLPQMAAHASNAELREAFNEHLKQTNDHVMRLSEITERHGISREAATCEAMKGLLVEAKRHLSDTAPGDVRDAVLIASGNRIEHYEIAGYGAAKAFAHSLGFDDDEDILGRTLKEEGEADAIITRIATGGMFGTGINESAAHHS